MRSTARSPYGRDMNRLVLDAHDSTGTRVADSFRRLRAAVRRWHSPTIFALIGLSFFLPFATVSCDNAETSFNGVQLVTRTVQHGGRVDEPPDCAADISTCVEQDASLSAEVALVAAIVGFLLGVFGVVKGPGWCAGVSLGALLNISPALDFLGPDVTTHLGFNGALALSGWAAAVHVVRAVRRRRGIKAGPGEMMETSTVPVRASAPAREVEP